ncbi:MAG: hypothetical protein IPK79_10115 [Vampirovibrionales bacterium]|nr:hypothetical protein [Vampirovibrionales bacterium]
MRIAARGLTLIEIAISMGLFMLVALAVATILSSGMDTQMAYRVHENEHNVAMNIIDSLRQDIIRAKAITVAGGGSQLVITSPSNAVINWSITGGEARRNGLLLSRSAFSPNIALAARCGGNGTTVCFEGRDQNGAIININPRRVVLNELTIVQQLPTGGGSKLDREFGAASYRVNDASFEVTTGTTFQ